jgi:ribosomal protein L37E
MLNIKTSACPKCAHTFLRYANECPECGFVTRRKKRSRARAKAILSSALAIAAACFFISQIPATETAFPSPVNTHSLSGSFQKPSNRTALETDNARHILLREADLQKNRTSAIYSAQ